MSKNRIITALLAFILISTLVFPTVTSAAKQRSLEDVCTVSVDKKDLFVASNPEYADRGHIDLTCDIKQITFTDLYSTVENPRIVKADDFLTQFDVTALSTGSTYVNINAPGYTPIKIKFNVGDSSKSVTNNKDTDEDYYSEDDTYTEDQGEYDPEYGAFLFYADQVELLAKLEDKAIAAYNQNNYMTSSNRKKTYLAFNNTIVPTYTKFVVGLKKIKPSQTELKKIHATFIKGASLQLEGLTLIKKSISTQTINMKTFNQAQTKLDAGRKLVKKYSADLEAYAATFE
ncbi:hypothetical protein [Paenibacillus sp. IHBB 10380]|uniref:hypothetical protein n=1 Tax=Paenibacillus sp. IHBB 10380 TaxID=1566358 RepID=UPI0005CFA51B|nr:hypothetical protein [Paenibacillus sp. IHBB 10380]AJS60956.1 hypothetical protein UB51_23675 [Paenibacillus sp. IHBB 10380]